MVQSSRYLASRTEKPDACQIFGAIACLELPYDVDDLIDILDRVAGTLSPEPWPIPVRRATAPRSAAAAPPEASPRTARDGDTVVRSGSEA